VKDTKVVLPTTTFILLPRHHFLRVIVGLYAFTVPSILKVTRYSKIASKQEATGSANGISDSVNEGIRWRKLVKHNNV
jgi:hypothetical protein